MPQPTPMTPTPGQPVESAHDSSLLDELLDAHSTDAGAGREELRALIGAMVGRLGNTLDTNAAQAIDKQIAEIDELLSSQLSEVMHTPEFQKLEGSWRGLHQLVTGSELGESLKVKVLNCSMAELQEDFADNAGVLHQSALYRKVFSEGLNQYGADPFGLLVGDFEFGSGAGDINLLKSIASVASICNAPFIASAAPSLVGVKSYDEVLDAPSLTALQESSKFAAWQSFRQSDDARYVGLTLPRHLGRLPYSADNSQGASSFSFSEAVSGRDHGKYLWTNTAYALDGRISNSFSTTGWCAAIRGPQGGGKVESLPVHSFTTDKGDVVAKCPTEIPLDESRDYELSKLGFIPLVWSKGDDFAAFFSTQSAYKPGRYTTTEASANAYLAAQLQFTLAMSRIAQMIKVSLRESVGTFSSAGNTATKLQEWLALYTLLDDDADHARKAEKPLRESQVTVTEDPSRPGMYRVEVFIRPHRQFDGALVDLSLVSEIPKPAN